MHCFLKNYLSAFTSIVIDHRIYTPDNLTFTGMCTFLCGSMHIALINRCYCIHVCHFGNITKYICVSRDNNHYVFSRKQKLKNRKRMPSSSSDYLIQNWLKIFKNIRKFFFLNSNAEYSRATGALTVETNGEMKQSYR